jgi:adenylate kinase family enzyme
MALRLGKSTLAQAIAHERGWPILDLDAVAWERQKVAVARDAGAAREDVARFCADHTDWIVEGCYGDLIAEALHYSPLLIFMDPGLEQCLANCRRRPWEAHKFRSKAEQDEKLAALLTWVRDYYVRGGSMSLDAHEALFLSYARRKQRLRHSSGLDLA